VKLDIFTDELIADDLDSIMVGFERDAPHQYEAKSVEISLKNISERVQNLDIDDEFELSAYGMPLPYSFFVESIEEDQKTLVKKLTLSPITKRLKDFQCGRINFGKYEDTDYHISVDHISDLVQELLLPSFSRFGDNGREGYLFDYFNFETPYKTKQDVVLTEPVTLEENSLAFWSDLAKGDTLFLRQYTLDGQITATDDDDSSVILNAGLYLHVYRTNTYYDSRGAEHTTTKNKEFYYLSREGSMRLVGQWRHPENIDHIEQQDWNNAEDWYDDPAIQDQVPDTDSVIVENPDGSQTKIERTQVKSYHYNYDDGTGPFWGMIQYMETQSIRVSGGDGGPSWLPVSAGMKYRLWYSTNFLNHYVRADYSNPSASEVWNDVAKMISGMWYAERGEIIMDSRIKPDLSEMVNLNPDDILDWKTTIQKRKKQDYYPSDSLKINTGLRAAIVDNMDAIYGEKTAYHRIHYYANLGEALRPGRWIRSGTQEVGLVNRITYYRNQTINIEATGAAQ